MDEMYQRYLPFHDRNYVGLRLYYIVGRVTYQHNYVA